MALIPLDAVTRQIRLNCRLLATQGCVSAGAGLFLWSLCPFVSDAVGWRYFSLTGGLIFGGTALYSAAQLSTISRLNAASLKAEERDYIHRIAASQYSQQVFWDTIATSNTSQPVEIPVTAESPETPGEEAATDFPSTSEFPGELVFSQIAEALESGKSDSHIVQEILGMKGRKYAEGKQMLTEIKEVLNATREGR